MIDDKKPFALRISEKTFKQIEEIAKREKRSINKQIEVLIEAYIKEYEESEHIKIEINGGNNTFNHGNKK